MARAEIPPGSFVNLGALRVPRLGLRRVRAYVPRHPPPSFGWPVLYMLDGQNVFGDEGSFAGGWHAHRAVDKLRPRTSHVPLIVAIDNGALRRLDEMAAWKDERRGGKAKFLVDWIADTLMPRVARRFDVISGPVGAAICGSSMGGLAALYAHFARPDSFGGAICMSSAFFWANRRIFDFVADSDLPPISRVYLDCGGKEGGGRLLHHSREMAELLRSRGYGPDQLRFRADRLGEHNERDWARRLPGALRFIYRRG